MIGKIIKAEFRQCARCVLDTTAPDIVFDEEGVCGYCRKFDRTVKDFIFKSDILKKSELESIVRRIKSQGLDAPYDCLIGLSGGVDSTYLAYFAKKEYGLRPLAVHFDNGWDSELAVTNIKQVVTRLGLDLYTHVIDWEQFRDLHLAYLKASVVDVEVPTDQLIFASLYKIAYEKKITTIISGCNNATEFIMPRGWNFNLKTDYVNLRNIHSRFGTMKLVNFPRLGNMERLFYRRVAKIREINLLEYSSLTQKEIKELIKIELNWRDYGYKHHESIFTRFYQGYILPKKFNIDKRKAHFSNLICSGQMSKEEALRELQKEPYPVEQQMADKEYVLKKFRLSEEEFENIMRQPIRAHEEFGLEKDYFKYPRKMLNFLRGKA